MQFVPDDGPYQSKDIASHKSDEDERNRCLWIERLDHVDGLDHVRPEHEIDKRLRPTDRHQQRPKEVPPANEEAKNQSNCTDFLHTVRFFSSIGLRRIEFLFHEGGYPDYWLKLFAVRMDRQHFAPRGL